MSETAPATAIPRRLLKPRIDVRRHNGIRAVDQIALFRQLRTMFAAGTPIHEALQVAAVQTESRRMAIVMRNVSTRVGGGATIAESFGAHPKAFRPEWVQIIRAAEMSGSLELALERIGQQIEEVVTFRSKMVSAMMYPAMVLSVSVLAVIAMLTFVVPTFVQLFDEAGKGLPGPTQLLVDASDFIKGYWHFLLLGAVGLVFAMRWLLRTKVGGDAVSRLLMATPLIGPLIVNYNMQRFARTIADLLESGVPLLQTLEVMHKVSVGNPVYGDALAEIGEQVSRGEQLADAVSDTGVFTPFLCNMLRVGEGTGSLPEVLQELADYYRERVTTFTARAATQIETLLIIVMSAVVGCILIALYLPLFEISTG